MNEHEIFSKEEELKTHKLRIEDSFRNSKCIAELDGWIIKSLRILFSKTDLDWDNYDMKYEYELIDKLAMKVGWE